MSPSETTSANDSDPAGGSAVRFRVDSGVAHLLLDAPERHNAIERVDVDALLRHLDEVDADPTVRVLVLTGSGERTFCSGASLPQMRSGAMSGEIFETLADRLAAVKAPSICALNGSVYGGGSELALCCDFRIGVAGSRLSVPAARLGVCYPVGGLRRYVTRLGLPAATRLLVAAEEMGAEAMLACGFLTDLVERDALEDATARLAERLAGLAPLATQAMKHVLGRIAAGTLDEAEAAALVQRCARSDDLQEGLAAQREGRTPRFEGR